MFIKINESIEKITKYRGILVISINILSIIFANYLAFLLRFDWNIPSNIYLLFLKTLPVIVMIKMFFISLYGLNKGLWRFVSTPDLLNIFKAVSLGVLVSLVTIYLLGFSLYPRSVFLIDWLCLILLIGGIRFQRKTLSEFSQFSPGEKKRVFLIGAGVAGDMLLREMRQNPNMQYNPVGFIDDNPRKKGLSIRGVNILGTRKDIPRLVNEYMIEELIIAIPSATAKHMGEIIKYCQKTGLKVKTIPGMGDIIDGKVSISQLREIRLEDLLSREVVKIDLSSIESYLSDKNILITGAGGSIGSELCRQVANFQPRHLLMLDQNENGIFYIGEELKSKFPDLSFTQIIGDIKNIAKLRIILEEYKPEMIIHAAAYKHVPLMEFNITEAVKNNIIAIKNLALLTDRLRIKKFILISTDKSVNPTSVMGATKRVSEFFIQKLSERSKSAFTIVRFGNVIGSDGSVVTLFRKQIQERIPLTVTDPEIKRYFMTIPEAVQLVLQASIISVGGEIFVLEMGEQIKIADLARNMITLSNLNLEQDLDIIYTGLRPGEKLYEELFEPDEKIENTGFDKIKKIVSKNGITWDDLNKKIDELEDLVKEHENTNHGSKKIILKLKEIVPTYRTRANEK